ncbi:hypothetical protein B0T22DRAFT_126015 [Podospora appendiculata]|uniref:Secreted protein n=1 Tax=Podospora appendiculata TaxID=314037 RepID=A0AAE0X7L6_9PEZI|nr:hypothetical protein B0T22DRAFT_126015 [Podospora appendiculata]
MSRCRAAVLSCCCGCCCGCGCGCSAARGTSSGEGAHLISPPHPWMVRQPVERGNGETHSDKRLPTTSRHSSARWRIWAHWADGDDSVTAPGSIALDYSSLSSS